MKVRMLLAALLLTVGLCFVPALGHGIVGQYKDPWKMEILTLEARLNYIMRNPMTFLAVNYWYDEWGFAVKGEGLPEDIDTSGKIIIGVIDNRNRYGPTSRIACPRTWILTLWPSLV